MGLLSFASYGPIRKLAINTFFGIDGKDPETSHYPDRVVKYDLFGL